MTDQSTQEVGHKSSLPVGKILASARTEQGMTTDMVAARLCLTESYIKALEAGNFEVLPGDTFIRGYLRNYADIVGLNGEELVRLYLEQQDIARQNAEAQKSENNSTKGSIKLVLIGVAIIVALIALALSLSDDDGSSLMQPSQSESSNMAGKALESESKEAIVSDANVEIIDQESQEIEENSLGDSSETNSGDELIEQQSQDTQGAIDGELITETTQSVSTEEASEASLATVSVSDGETEIELATETISFVFTGDCWYQVVDATGKKLAERSKSAGDTSVIEGVPPFTVTLGDSTVVNVMYNGELVDLTPYYERKAARFQVGE